MYVCTVLVDVAVLRPIRKRSRVCLWHDDNSWWYFAITFRERARFSNSYHGKVVVVVLLVALRVASVAWVVVAVAVVLAVAKSPR